MGDYEDDFSQELHRKMDAVDQFLDSLTPVIECEIEEVEHAMMPCQTCKAPIKIKARACRYCLTPVKREHRKKRRYQLRKARLKRVK